MVTPVICLNLFFVPAVALFEHSKQRNEELRPSLKLLVEYAILVSCNVPLTKVGVFFIKKLLQWNISIDSGYYTLLAIIAAAVLPGLLDLGESSLRGQNGAAAKMQGFLTKRTMRYRQKLYADFLLLEPIYEVIEKSLLRNWLFRVLFLLYCFWLSFRFLILTSMR